MQQAIHALYPRAEVRYVFINRGQHEFPTGFAERLRDLIQNMAGRYLSAEELAYLERTCYFLTPVYLDFLRHYRFNPDEVQVKLVEGELQIFIEGPWYRTVLWEVPLMAMISELYFEMSGFECLPPEEQHTRNLTKAVKLSNKRVKFADFGTRRRYSSDNHRIVLDEMSGIDNSTLIGTSNVYLAKYFDIKPIGTHAHEWFMFHGALNGYKLANRTALRAWSHVYKGNLGIALSDTYTTDVFLESFDSVMARLFDGVRHDSGDPWEFTQKIIRHYKKLHINPMTKTIVFSDGLDVDKAIDLQFYCDGKINASFGIGTNLTNDIGPAALNMVIKLSQCRKDKDSEWLDTVKLSDVQGKNTGAPEEIELCIRTLERNKK